MDHTDRKILKALMYGQYSYRTVNSLASETELEESDTVRRLERMRDQALAGKKITASRNLWFLTDKGCNWLATHASNDEAGPGRPVK